MNPRHPVIVRNEVCRVKRLNKKSVQSNVADVSGSADSVRVDATEPSKLPTVEIVTVKVENLDVTQSMTEQIPMARRAKLNCSFATLVKLGTLCVMTHALQNQFRLQQKKFWIIFIRF